MSLKVDGDAVIACDDCGTSHTCDTLDLALDIATSERWRVAYAPEVQHYCPACGAKPEHELAISMRSAIKSGVVIPSAPTQSLNDIVADAAIDRAERVLVSEVRNDRGNTVTSLNFGEEK